MRKLHLAQKRCSSFNQTTHCSKSLHLENLLNRFSTYSRKSAEAYSTLSYEKTLSAFSFLQTPSNSGVGTKILLNFTRILNRTSRRFYLH